MNLFNRALHRKRRNKAAATLPQVDFLLREAADRLADRLQDMQRGFPLALDLGCHLGYFGSEKIGSLIRADMSEKMLRQAQGTRHKAVVADEEFLPFAAHSFDAVFSGLSLHWVNDLPGCLIQICRALKPDGLFLAVVPGPRSLQELRESLLAVSTETGKIAPRISPFVEVRDAGALLQRAGFALPVVDSEMLALTYREPLTLLNELRQMGEANALIRQHQGLTGKSFWPRVMDYYQQHFSDAQGRLKVTAELIFMTAWSPHESQQQPARRGSGQIDMGAVLTSL